MLLAANKQLVVSDRRRRVRELSEFVFGDDFKLFARLHEICDAIVGHEIDQSASSDQRDAEVTPEPVFPDFATGRGLETVAVGRNKRSAVPAI